MTDKDLEEFVRDTFRSREHEIDKSAGELLPAVQRKARRRRGGRIATAGLVTAAVLVGAGVLVSRVGSGTPSEPIAPPMATGSTTPSAGRAPDVLPLMAPPGWRLESSLGAVTVVPDDWAVNDFGCGMTDRSTVVRGQSAQTMCFTPEPATKEVAVIQPAHVEPQGLSPRAYQIPGAEMPALRAETTLADGRFAGWVAVPSRDVSVLVRTRSAQTTKRILDEFRLVDTDHVGCTVKRPKAPAPAGGTFAVPAGADVSICAYNGQDDRLTSSTMVRGEQARKLTDKLASASPGANEDSSDCLDKAPAPDMVLLVHDKVGAPMQIWVTYSGCVGRGMQSTTGRAQVTSSLLELLHQPLHLGYGHSLPN